MTKTPILVEFHEFYSPLIPVIPLKLLARMVVISNCDLSPTKRCLGFQV